MIKKILFLVGYDYFDSLCQLNEKFEIISPKNEPAFQEEIQNKFRSFFSKNFHLVDYSKNSLLEKIRSIDPQVVITLGWRRIIPKDLLNSHITWVNIHPAILPQYKGYHPVPYVLMNEEKEHGITAHYINEAVDAGDIIMIKKFPINDFSTIKDIQQKVRELFPTFLSDLVDVIQQEEVPTIKNDASLTKIVAKRRIPEDSEIPPDMPFREVYNHIRACDSERFPAYFVKNGEKVIVKLEMPEIRDSL